MERTSKKELKIVLNAELYDELRYVFRPDQLENIIYKPEIINEKRWLCCCGSESELEICPICGMEKHTVLSKVNPGYLAHHRKMRIQRKKKAMQDQQAMMAAQIIKKNKKSTKKNKSVDTKKIGTVIGILLLCIALIASVAIIFGGNSSKDPSKKPDETKTNVTTQDNGTTNSSPDTDEPVSDETTVPPVVETDPPETTPPEPVVVPNEAVNKNPATLKDGQYAPGASGNTTAGSLVFSGETHDYVAIQGLRVVDKNGAEISVITEKTVLGVTATGSFVFYIDENYNVHRYNTESTEDIILSYRAKQICVFFDEIYYTSPDETGLFAANLDGYRTKIITNLEIFAVSNTADKLYFSTSESLGVITSKDGSALTFCKDGAKATSIFEITNCVFYTAADGKLKFFFPQKKIGFGIEYPIYDVNITHVSAFGNRVYVKTVNPRTNAVLWYVTTWTPGTKLFTPAKFRSTGITTESLYVSNNAVYDGNLVRKPIA